jgi:hypothetical protein
MLPTQDLAIKVTIPLCRNCLCVCLTTYFHPLAIEEGDVFWDKRVVERVEVEGWVESVGGGAVGSWRRHLERTSGRTLTSTSIRKQKLWRLSGVRVRTPWVRVTSRCKVQTFQTPYMSLCPSQRRTFFRSVRLPKNRVLRSESRHASATRAQPSK